MERVRSPIASTRGLSHSNSVLNKRRVGFEPERDCADVGIDKARAGHTPRGSQEIRGGVRLLSEGIRGERS